MVTDKEGLRDTIKGSAVRLFSEKGFHGTSMREIAKLSGCSLPMLYYYYQNKEELFYELAFREFTALLARLNSELPRDQGLLGAYHAAIRQRMGLGPYDKAVFKLALKVWLGFDGDSKVRADIMEWEKGRMGNQLRVLSNLPGGDPDLLPVFSRVMVRLIENMTERIILFDERLGDDDVLEELAFVMNAAKRTGDGPTTE